MQDLTLAAVAHGPIDGGKLHALSLCVCPASELEEMEVSMATGVVKARVNQPIDALYEYYAYHGPLMMQQLRVSAEAESDLTALGHRVEKALRLRRLYRDSLLSSEEYKSGCYRLLRYRDALTEYVEGTTLRLGQQNGILPGSTVVDVAFDFMM